MRTLGAVFLVLAMVLGGLAVWGLRAVSSAQAAPAPAAATSQVVVAARAIEVGEPLNAIALRLQPWPAGAVPPGAMTSIGQATAGQPIALSAIAPNEPILKSRISGPGARPTLSGVIRTGMRAASIRVDDVAGVAGFVRPGDFVDVMVTRPDGPDAGELRTDVLLQGLRVLAVDQVASENKNDPQVAKAATVELSAEQAQKLALARQVGVVSLALRGTADPMAAAAARTIRLTDIGGAPRRASLVSEPGPTAPIQAPRAARLAAASGPVMTIYRGAAPATVAVRAE